MRPVNIFISCVTNEFRSYRDRLFLELRRPGLSIEVQENFIATGTETLEKLDSYVKGCDAVIHLAGYTTGAMATPRAVAPLLTTYPYLAENHPALEPGLSGKDRFSYTQWEAYLSAYHGKVLLIAHANEHAPRDSPIDTATAESQRDAQQAHLQRLRQMGRYPEFSFKTQDDLAIVLLRSKLFDILKHLDTHEAADPYLANRDAQLGVIRKSLSSHPFYLQRQEAADCPRVNAFIVPTCSHEDAPDKFIERLVAHDGPALPGVPLGTEVSHRYNGSHRWPNHYLKWPSGLLGVHEFADAYWELNVSRIEAGVAQGIKQAGPVCFHTECIAEGNNTNQYLNAWLTVWEGRFSKLTTTMLGARCLTLPIISILMVDVSGYSRGGLFSFLRRQERIYRQIEEFRPSDAIKLNFLMVAALTRLGKITRQDARDWINEWVPESVTPPMRQHVAELEHSGAFPMTLQAFSTAIKSGTTRTWRRNSR